MRTAKGLALALARAAHADGQKDTPEMMQSRRAWLKNVALFGASGALLMACGKEEKKVYVNASYSADDAKTDVGYLNAALALEHEAISIYTQAAALTGSQWTGNIPNTSVPNSTLKDIAVGFKDHHVAHRDALIATINEMKTTHSTGIDPVTAKTDAEYLPSAVVATLTTAAKVYQAAAAKELGAAQAYNGLIKSFKDPNLAATSGFLGGDEAAHYAAIRAVLFGLLGNPDTLTAATVLPKALFTKA